MKALLMHRVRDFDVQQELPWNERDLTQDLELETLFGAMAAGDNFLLDVVRRAILSGLHLEVNTIRYRQDVLRDALENAGVVRKLYDLAVETIEARRAQYWGIGGNYPASVLHGSIDLLHIFVDMLRKLRALVREHSFRFRSEGFANLFATIQRELTDEYFAQIGDHLKELKFRRGVLISAKLGPSNEGTRFVLRKPRGKGPSWLDRLLGKAPPSYTFHLAERDEAGARALSELRDRGITLVANALGQSADHLLSFFVMLRTELAFYVGCLNLHDRLTRRGLPTGFPQPEPAGRRALRFTGLYDACLALTMEGPPVGNTVHAEGKSLMVVTGANQGGKSTFLRSVGLAQLMMQSGMFVAADSFTGEVTTRLCTHYKREEDATMKSGKLDEELARMSDIADHLGPDAMLLFNESFAATNEREGSEIARQVVRALLEKRVKVFFVTHLYEFARLCFEREMPEAMFLRAERRADGTRTFRVLEGEPLETSYGQDLYKQVFESATAGNGSGQSARRDGVALNPAGTDAHEGPRPREKIPEEATSEGRKE